MLARHKKLFITLAVILVLVLGTVIWYFIPITLPSGITYSDVNEIVIFDNATGRMMHLKDKDDIREIVEGFQSVKMHRNGGLFTSLDGPAFEITFKYGSDKAAELRVYGEEFVKVKFDYKPDEPLPCYGRITDMLKRMRSVDPEERNIEAKL